MTGATVKNSVTLEATYRISDLPDDSVIGKTETITVAGKTVSSPLHTLKIEKEYSGEYVVKGFYPIPDDGNPRIPAYIDSIDMRAFRGCTKLKNAVFTDTAVKERIKTLRILIFGKCWKKYRLEKFLKSCQTMGG